MAKEGGREERREGERKREGWSGREGREKRKGGRETERREREKETGREGILQVVLSA